MAQVRITERNGTELTIEARSGQPFRETLPDSNPGLQGHCGGPFSCCTLQASLAAPWANQLPPQSEEEQMMPERLRDLGGVRPTLRLALQGPPADCLSRTAVLHAPGNVSRFASSVVAPLKLATE